MNKTNYNIEFIQVGSNNCTLFCFPKTLKTIIALTVKNFQKFNAEDFGNHQNNLVDEWKETFLN